MQKIVPNLWFDSLAEEAAKFYVSLFPDSIMGSVSHYGPSAAEVSGQPEGSVLTAEFTLAGLDFLGLNGGPQFKVNPSISFLVACDSKDQVDELWAKLSPGGKVLMALDKYPFSEHYGWTEDKYGVSWQLMQTSEPIKHKITPTLMYTGKQAGRAEEAMQFYTSLFKDSVIGDVNRYPDGMAPEKAGSIMHATFTLAGQMFAAMDSAQQHEFAFNEGVSLQVNCVNQAEVDELWAKLTADGGQESVCGWLKDKFGVSWQIVPTVLGQLLQDPDAERVERVMTAMLKMKKLDEAALKTAANG